MKILVILLLDTVVLWGLIVLITFHNFGRSFSWHCGTMSQVMFSHSYERSVCSAINKTVAELRCVIWTSQSLSAIQVVETEVWMDDSAAIEAILNSSKWSRFRSLTTKIHKEIVRFRRCAIKLSSSKANTSDRKECLLQRKNDSNHT